MRQHLPFWGRPDAPSRLRSERPPRVGAGPIPAPFAFVTAFITCATKERGRRETALPRSRIFPARSRRSEASSLLMRKSLRLRYVRTSGNQRSSHHGVEKEMGCGTTHTAGSLTAAEKQCADKPLHATGTVALILPFLTPFADCTPIDAIAQIHSQRDPMKIGAVFAKNCADHVTEEDGKLRTHDATFAPSGDIPSAPSCHRDRAFRCPTDAGSDAELLLLICKCAATWPPESRKPSDSKGAENSPSDGRPMAQIGARSSAMSL
jgi:hypothetical protein